MATACASEKVDGNDVFDVMDTVAEAKKYALEGKPTLIEAKTFRMRGHEEACRHLLRTR
ncbi:MAG: thiamine pyrophosphate-dependent enzyme [Fodinibius sp.]|nr:thiamine pyrophosphate-dependent enzyme [Fodinibius sp.]